MKIRNYRLGNRGIRIGLLTDLHNRPYEEIIAKVRKVQPDLIAVAGDITYSFDAFENAGGFLTACQKLAPTYYSVGNHDSMEDERFLRDVKESGARMLDDCYEDICIAGVKLRIGGLTSPSSRRLTREEKEQGVGELRIPNIKWLEEFCKGDMYKVLLCHQPEYYPRYLYGLPIDLVLCGHAHGGQWRIGNQGIYAPGQGLFPKLTGGVMEGKKLERTCEGWTCEGKFGNKGRASKLVACDLEGKKGNSDRKHDLGKGNYQGKRCESRVVISRGLSNTVWIPRFFNPREIVMIDM